MQECAKSLLSMYLVCAHTSPKLHQKYSGGTPFHGMCQSSRYVQVYAKYSLSMYLVVVVFG